MPKLTTQCPICAKKNPLEKSHFNIGSSKFITLDCGHTFKESLSVTKLDKIKLLDGKELMPFQNLGVHFAEQSGLSCLIADEQGLGKTIEATAILHLHLEELKPVLIIVKAALTIQWQRHILTELEKFAQIVQTKSDLLPNLPIYICSYDTVGKIDWSKVNPKTIILDECQMIKNNDAKRTNSIRDLMNRSVEKKPIPLSEAEKNKRIKKAEMLAKDLMTYHGIYERFKLQILSGMGDRLGMCRCRVKGEGIITGDIWLSKDHVESDSESEIIETILHEIAHAITPGAGHLPIWSECSRSIGGDGLPARYCQGTVDPDAKEKIPIVKHKIFLSGTPIENNATEYWPSLNMLRPRMFPNRANFIKYEVGYYQDSKGRWKPGGIKDPKSFKTKTSDFIIRRTRKEVLPELPVVTRDFRYHSLTMDEMKAYSLGIKKLADFLKTADEKHFQFHSQLQGHIMILRHITGLAKISPALEYIDEFLESERDSSRKIAIFHHHIDVGDILQKHIQERKIDHIRIVAAQNAIQRTDNLDRFRKEDDCRLMIAPSLASGTGYDLEFCDTGMLLEREWNPSKEGQVEGRFIRATPEVIEKARLGLLKVTMVYPVAVGTVDEDFAELVEVKRQNFDETMDGYSEVKWNETDIMRDLATIAIKKWKEFENDASKIG